MDQRLKEGEAIMRKIEDLIEDAVKCDDYEKRINFLVAGLLCEDANDTPEKEQQNNKYLKDIYDFCDNYSGEKKTYFDQLKKTIRNYLSYAENK